MNKAERTCEPVPKQHQAPKARKRLRPVSPKRAGEKAERDAVREIVLEQTLNQRAGTLTRFFGFVPSHDDTDNVGVIYAIRADPDLSEAQADALVALYEHFAGTP